MADKDLHNSSGVREVVIIMIPFFSATLGTLALTHSHSHPCALPAELQLGTIIVPLLLS